MTTEPRSLREIVAHALVEADPRAAVVGEDDEEAADAILAALRTALAANPELIGELLPAAAEAASIVRDLAKRDPTWRERYMGRDGFVCTLCSSASIQQPDCPHVRAVEWVTEHPEAGNVSEKRDG